MNDNIQNKIDGGETAGKKAKLKKILYPLLFAVVIIGCCTGYYMFSVNMNYFSTDNAKVTAKLYSVMPVTSGKLISSGTTVTPWPAILKRMWKTATWWNRTRCLAGRKCFLISHPP